MDQSTLQLLDKLIALYSWSPQCLRSLERMAGRDEFCEAIHRIEAALSRSQEDKPLPKEEAQCDGEGCYELYEACVRSAPLFALMQAQPLISKSAPEVTRTLAKLADVSPHPETILGTGDPSFARILKMLARDGSLSIDDLAVENLTKLIAFAAERPALFALLHELAQTEGWFEQIAALEHRLARADNGATTELTPPAKALYEKLSAPADDLDAEPLSRPFLAEPRFSTMLPLEVLAFASIRHSLPRVESLLAKQFLDAASPIDKYRRVAREATRLFEEMDKQALQTALGLRRDAAQHFLELRKFAKLDALAFKWPQLAQQLRMDGPSILKALEAVVLEPGSYLEDKALAGYLRDEQLVRFLRLRPLFKEIYQDEVTKYFAVSQAVTKPPEAVKAVPPSRPSPPKATADLAPYDNLVVTIQPVADAFSVGLTLNGTSLAEHKFTPAPGETESIFAHFGTGTYEYAPATRSVRAAARAVDAASLYRDVGTKIFDVFFGAEKTKKALRDALLGRPRVRLALDLRVPQLAPLPWECLYLQGPHVFLGLAQKYSIVRHVTDRTMLSLRTLAPPLKILVVAAMPKDAPYIETSREVETLERALAEPIDNGQVVLQVLKPPTLSELQSALRRFRPHLLHFIGHGTYLPDQKGGALLFENDEGNGVPVEAPHLQTLLTDSNISLAVLNACDTGTSQTNEVVTGVAGALVHHGIPAAIATMRPVEDPAAVMFTREFYRSFVDGYPLEAALVEARKALSVEKWDWTAYALFASTLDLEPLRLLPQLRSAEAA